MSIDFDQNLANVAYSDDDESLILHERAIERFLAPDGDQHVDLSHFVDPDNHPLILDGHGDAHGANLLDLDMLLNSDLRWGPALALRGAFRNARYQFGVETDEFRDACQDATILYFRRCHPESFVVTPVKSGVKKTVTPSPQNLQSVYDIFLGATARKVFIEDLSKWPDDLALHVANISHDAKTFRSGTSARKHVTNRLNDANNLSTVLFADRDLASLTRRDINHQRPCELRDWLVSLGLLQVNDTQVPGSKWYEVNDVASFKAGPLDAATMLRKEALCEDAYFHLRKFVSASHPSPTMFITLTLRPELFTEGDLRSFALIHKIPGVTMTSLYNVVKAACKEVGRTQLLEFWRVHDDSPTLATLPESWIGGMFLFVTFHLRQQFDQPGAIRLFMAASRTNKLKYLCDQVSDFARSA
eukprot:gene44189-54930_t